MNAVTPWTLSLSQVVPRHWLLYPILARADLFAIWSVCLLAIGLYFGLGCRIERARIIAAAAAAVYVVYLVAQIAVLKNQTIQ